MNVTNRTTSTNTINTYEIDLGEGKGKIVYIEYLNESGKLMDETLRDETGNEIDDGYLPNGYDNAAALLEEVQKFVDNL